MKILLICTCAAVLAMASFSPQAMAGFEFTPSVSLSETFSDNVDQEPDGAEDSAFLTDITPSFILRWQSARITAALDAATTLRFQSAGEDEGVEVLPEASGVGTYEVFNDLFFIDASVASARELINTRDTNTDANRNLIQNYSASPYLVGHFGNFADSELRYTFDQVLADDSNGTPPTPGDDDTTLSNSTTHSGQFRLTSGSDFSRLSWTLGSDISESIRSNDDNINRYDASLDLEYAFTRWLSLLGSGGYQHFDDGDPSNDIDDPTWNAGIRLRPGPRTEIQATYGVTDDEDSLAASLTYRISSRTTFTASYEEKLLTGQDRLNQDLSFIAVDPATGALIDSRTGLPFDPSTATTSLVNDTERTKTLRVGLVGTHGRNAYQLEATLDKSEEQGSDPVKREELGFELNASWQRRLSTRSDFEIFGNYQRNEFDPENRTDNEYEIGGIFNYVVFTNVNAFASYTFNKQTSTDPADEFTENILSIGVQMSF